LIEAPRAVCHGGEKLGGKSGKSKKLRLMKGGRWGATAEDGVWQRKTRRLEGAKDV